MSRVFGCIITLSIFFGLKALFENCFILYYRNFTQKEAGIYEQLSLGLHVLTKLQKRQKNLYQKMKIGFIQKTSCNTKTI